VSRFRSEDTCDLFGASFHESGDPAEAVATIMHLLNERRERLGINRKAARKLFDMKDRRELSERSAVHV
jgi:hypothetical protein